MDVKLVDSASAVCEFADSAIKWEVDPMPENLPFRHRKLLKLIESNLENVVGMSKLSIRRLQFVKSPNRR